MGASALPPSVVLIFLLHNRGIGGSAPDFDSLSKFRFVPVRKGSICHGKWANNSLKVLWYLVVPYNLIDCQGEVVMKVEMAQSLIWISG